RARLMNERSEASRGEGEGETPTESVEPCLHFLIQIISQISS
ncbi:hypothetical protein MIMGU_mgv11b0235912mg, partial [Erythranthe guttata]